MIFKGRKVLDGTLVDSVDYGYDTPIAHRAGTSALAGLDGVVEINDFGNLQEFRWRW